MINKNKKLAKLSKIVTWQPKPIEKPNIIYRKLITLDYSKPFIQKTAKVSLEGGAKKNSTTLYTVQQQKVIFF